MKLFIALLAFTHILLASQMNWNHDYALALQEAKQQNKDVYMLITSEACKWCRKLESTTLQDKVVLAKLEENYVLLHVSRDKDYIPSKFKTKRVPRHYFLSEDGENIYTFLGHWDSDDFISFVNESRKQKNKRK